MLPALLLVAATTVGEVPLGPLLDRSDEAQLDDRVRSSKLQDVLKRRTEAVGVARPKIEALLDEARSKGAAKGPIADWIKNTFKHDADAGFLMMINGQLTIGLLEPKTWVEPPAARPACSSSRFSAVANQGQDTVWLCDKFYGDSIDEGALTLFHEAQHLRSMGDCEGGLSRNIPPEKRICAQNFEALFRFLWKGN